MNDQLILKFPSKKAYLKEDFYVSESNEKAYDFVNAWPKWIKKILNIYGPSRSGKTHLASILKSKTTVLIKESKQLDDKIFFEFKTKEVLIIENLKDNVSEKILYSLWNTASQDNKFLIITSEKPINPNPVDLLIDVFNGKINNQDYLILSVFIAQVFRKLNKDSLALKYYKKTLDKQKNPNIYYNIGCILSDNRKTKMAIKSVPNLPRQGNSKI